MSLESVDETFDFVIVGSGGGSMCAALYMKSVGKTALILEKTDMFGGTTARSGGAMWIPNNRFMKPAGVEDSFDNAMLYLDNVVGDAPDTPGATRERRASYVTEAPRMVDFLVSQGVKLGRYGYWPDYYDDLPGGTEGRSVVADLFDLNELGEAKALMRPSRMSYPGWNREVMKVLRFKTTWAGKWAMFRIGLRMMTSRVTGRKWVSAGTALQGRMFLAARKAKVDMRLNAAVKRLIVDERGVVRGVVADVGGKERSFGARDGVLVNAGGFSRNQAMRDKYQPGTRAEWSNTAPGDTGEMIEEMMRLGAAVAQMDEMIGLQITLRPDKPELNAMVQGDLSSPHSIIVDQSGVRYMREAQSYMAFCKGMFERNKTVPAVPSWLVLDSEFMAKYMLANTFPGLKTKPKDWLENGFLKTGKTIDELARACGMDPATLVSTVERFNGFARAGKDDDFHRGDRRYDNFLGDPAHKPSRSLGTIERAPFYAYLIYPGDAGTYGGVVTDPNARVLRDDGSVIPGLYATGISTASVMGRAYPGAGSSLGPSFTFGYVAAKHAARVNHPEAMVAVDQL